MGGIQPQGQDSGCIEVTEAVGRLSRVVEHWQDAVIGVTLEGIVVTWNRGARQVYGYSTEEVVGKHISILGPSGNQGEISEVLSSISEGRSVAVYDTAHRRKDNTLIQVSLAVSPVKDAAGNTVAASIIARSVSEHKQVEDIFSALMNSSPIGMYIVQGGLFQYVSRQFAHILGYNQDEILGTESLSYVYSDDRDKVRANAIEALKSGYCRPYEYRVRTKSDELKWILETVISVPYKGRKSTLGNFMDITDRRQAQEKMRDANEKLTVLVQKFEKQNKMNSILTEMRDLLQACSTMEETIPIIMSSMTRLFPKTEGALFLMSASRTDLESVARWGGFPEDVEDNIFAPSECWGLRRGRAHVAEDIEIGPICSHLKHAPRTAYVCLPLMAKGDVLGLLHLRILGSIPEQDKQQSITDLKDMAVSLSEYLSLAVANIRLSESLSTQSIRDSLSGLFNRRYMEETLQREIQRAARKRSQIGVVMADLDYFKKFNDTYGHAAGDMCISLVGRLFKQRIRASDIACRYGGEEFVLIFPDCSAEDAYKRADSLREELRKMELVFQGQFIGSITISMGVAAYPASGIGLDDLLRAADRSLYRAKQEGRDRVAIKD